MPHSYLRLILAVAVAGALMLSVGAALPAAAQDSGADKKTEAKDDKKSGDKAAAKDEGNNHHYVKIPPLILPVIGDNGVEQIISIVVVIEASSQENATAITDMVPKLSDAYLTALYGTLDRRERMKNGVIDVPYLKQKLTELSVKILGADKMKDLLIQGVSQHPS